MLITIATVNANNFYIVFRRILDRDLLGLGYWKVSVLMAMMLILLTRTCSGYSIHRETPAIRYPSNINFILNFKDNSSNHKLNSYLIESMRGYFKTDYLYLMKDFSINSFIRHWSESLKLSQWTIKMKFTYLIDWNPDRQNVWRELFNYNLIAFWSMNERQRICSAVYIQIGSLFGGGERSWAKNTIEVKLCSAHDKHPLQAQQDPQWSRNVGTYPLLM